MSFLSRLRVGFCFCLVFALMSFLAAHGHTQTTAPSPVSTESTAQLFNVANIRLPKHTFDLPSVSAPLSMHAISFARPLPSSPFVRSLAWKTPSA